MFCVFVYSLSPFGGFKQESTAQNHETMGMHAAHSKNTFAHDKVPFTTCQHHDQMTVLGPGYGVT